MIRNDPPTHKGSAPIYQSHMASHDAKQIKTRKGDVLLPRLRSGHHPSLQQCLPRLDPPQYPICLNCRLNEQDLHHWLCEFPATMTIRQRVLGNYKGFLEWLAIQPVDVVTFARKTLVNLDA